MKIKDINSNEFYKETRFNKNVTGKILEVTHGNKNEEKRESGAMSILSLMTMCGYYENAGSIKDTLKKMFDNSRNITNEKSVKL